MSLTKHDNEIAAQFALLAELEEPEALLAQFRQACSKMADRPQSDDMAKRWASVADALTQAERTVNAAQEPNAGKHSPKADEQPNEEPPEPKKQAT